MENKMFLNFCKVCKGKTANIISHSSRKRGVKLICVECQTETLGYKNFQNLKEFNLETAENSFNEEQTVQKLEEKPLDSQEKQNIHPKKEEKPQE